MNKILPFIFGQIETERARQDEQWGGAAHDDEHTLADWCEQIEKHRNLELKELAAGENGDYTKVRDRLIKIAALAAAAAESQDRINFGFITKENTGFDEWMKQVRTVGILYGLYDAETQIDTEIWRGNYDDGETPLEAVIEDLSQM